MLLISSSGSLEECLTAACSVVRHAVLDLRYSMTYTARCCRVKATRIRKRLGRLTRKNTMTSSVFWRRAADERPIIRTGEWELFLCNFVMESLFLGSEVPDFLWESTAGFFFNISSIDHFKNSNFPNSSIPPNTLKLHLCVSLLTNHRLTNGLYPWSRGVREAGTRPLVLEESHILLLPDRWTLLIWHCSWMSSLK